MAKKKKAKAKVAYKYVAIPKTTSWGDPWVFKTTSEMLERINDQDINIQDYNFYQIGGKVNVEITVTEPKLVAKKAKIK